MGVNLLVNPGFDTKIPRSSPEWAGFIYNKWVPVTVYESNEYATPALTHNGHYYRVTNYGSVPHSSGASEPTWPTGSGATVADGDLTWTEQGAIVSEVTPSGMRSGSKCLKLNDSTTNFIYQRVSVGDGTGHYYRASAWVKTNAILTEKVNNGGGCQIGIRFLDSGNTDIGGTYHDLDSQGAFDSDSNWIQLFAENAIPAPSGTAKVELRIYHRIQLADNSTSTGSTLVDDCYLEDLGTANTHTLANRYSSTSNSPAVYFDSFGRCVVNGQLFFPRGFYINGTGTTLDGYCDDILAKGYNTALNYSVCSVDLAGAKDIVDRMTAKNVKCIVPLHRFWQNYWFHIGAAEAHPEYAFAWDGITYDGTTTSIDAMHERLVNGLKDKAGVLAWYMSDEISTQYTTQFKRVYDKIVGWDKDHPCYGVLTGTIGSSSSGQNPNFHMDNLDVIGYDIYPNKDVEASTSGARSAVYDWGKNIYRDHIPTMPLWTVGQSQMALSGETNHPTEALMMNWTYQQLVNGARGILFWGYYKILALTDVNPTYYRSTQLTRMANIGAHLTAIEPIVLGQDASANAITTCSDSNIKMITRMVVNDMYILAVNVANTASTSPVFTLGAGVTADSVDKGTPGGSLTNLAVSTNAFTDTGNIGAYSTAIYRINLTTTTLTNQPALGKSNKIGRSSGSGLVL